LSHSSSAKNVSDLIDGTVQLRGSGGSSAEFDENVLNVLDALSLDKEPLDIFFSLFELSFQLSVLFLDVFVVLIQFFVFISEQEHLLLLFLNIAHKVRVRLVGLVQ
jgi:hypothetical protein